MVHNGYGLFVFCLAALVPSPPILVPALCGGRAVVPHADSAGSYGAQDYQDEQIAEIRAAVRAAVATVSAMAQRWTVVGVAATAQRLPSSAVGTFRGYGLDLPVALSSQPSQEGLPPGHDTEPSNSMANADRAVAADPWMPLPALLAGWLREDMCPEAVVDARIFAEDTPVDRCMAAGRQLRAELDADVEPRGVLVIADGAATLSRAAPGYFDVRAPGVQRALDRALAGGGRAALVELEPQECTELALSGRAAYQVLAGLVAADPADPVVEPLYRGAPFGVGYGVGVWRPSSAKESQ